jgi:predicted lipid-binding transport protein (Tim44 family)
MNSEMIQILVLAAIALFLVLRLRNVLGTRDGFEKSDPPPLPGREAPQGRKSTATMGLDAEADIPDDIQRGGPVHAALLEMKAVEPDFSVTDFLRGAKQAYEMIVMGYENGDLSDVRAFLAPEVAEGFDSAIDQRRAAGLTVEARFVGLRDLRVTEAAFDRASGLAEITLRLTGELTSVVRNADGQIVEGDASAVRKQTDHFTFERRMGADDPNWILVSTGG